MPLVHTCNHRLTSFDVAMLLLEGRPKETKSTQTDVVSMMQSTSVRTYSPVGSLFRASGPSSLPVTANNTRRDDSSIVADGKDEHVTSVS